MIRLFGGAINKGQVYGKSVKLAPQVIRNHLRLDKSKYIDHNDYEDYNDLSNAITKNVNKNDFSLIFGGDHSISIHTISSLKKIRSNMKVLWIDAHADCNNKKTSLSGNLHGMPLGYLLGREKSVYQSLSYDDVMYIGIRDVDPLENEYIKEKNIKSLTMKEYNKTATEDIYYHISKYVGNNPLHISLDIDSCDSSITPGTGVPVPDGFNQTQICNLIKTLFDREYVVSMELVEYFPEFDKDNITLNLIKEIMLRTKIKSIIK